MRTRLAVLALLAAGCVEVEEPAPCVPRTCGEGDCLSIEDGCGGFLACGACADGAACVEGRCEPCVSVACGEPGGPACGTGVDACGSAFACGACAADERCTVEHRCEPIPPTADCWSDPVRLALGGQGTAPDGVVEGGVEWLYFASQRFADPAADAHQQLARVRRDSTAVEDLPALRQDGQGAIYGVEVRRDGLEPIFTSSYATPLPGNGHDWWDPEVWHAYRASVDEPFGTPELLLGTPGWCAEIECDGYEHATLLGDDRTLLVVGTWMDDGLEEHLFQHYWFEVWRRPTRDPADTAFAPAEEPRFAPEAVFAGDVFTYQGALYEVTSGAFWQPSLGCDGRHLFYLLRRGGRPVDGGRDVVTVEARVVDVVSTDPLVVENPRAVRGAQVEEVLPTGEERILRTIHQSAACDRLYVADSIDVFELRPASCEP